MLGVLVQQSLGKTAQSEKSDFGFEASLGVACVGCGMKYDQDGSVHFLRASVKPRWAGCHLGAGARIGSKVTQLTHVRWAPRCKR